MRLKNPFELSLQELTYRYADTQRERASQRLERTLLSVGGRSDGFQQIKQAKDNLRQAEIWAETAFREFLKVHPAIKQTENIK